MTASSSLWGFLGRRLVLLAVTLVLVPSLSFVMFTLIDGRHTAPLEVLEQLRTYLDATFLRADAGGENFRNETFIRTRGAFEVVTEGFAVDCYLLGGALVLGVGLGLLAGGVQALRPRSPISRAISVATALVLSSPVYWLGLIVLLLFGPTTGDWLKVPFVSPVAGYHAPSDDPLLFLQGIWMPWLIVAAPLAAACTRMCAAQLGGALEEDYVRSARAKGLHERRVLRRHALPPASAPVIALVGVNMNLILTNLALTEVVFNMPGSFRYIERALVNRDVDLVQALVLEGTLFIVVANFLADAVHAWLDPRVRTGEPF